MILPRLELLPTEKRGNGCVQGAQFAGERLLRVVDERQHARHTCQRILGGAAGVQGGRRRVVASSRPPECRDVDPQLLDHPLEVLQLRSQLPELLLSCPATDLGAVVLRAATTNALTELPTTPGSRAEIRELL